jgi:hypothetical protein
MNEIFVCGWQRNCKLYEPQGGFTDEIISNSGIAWARAILPCAHIRLPDMGHPPTILEKVKRTRFINAGAFPETVMAILATAPLAPRPNEQEVISVEKQKYRIWREIKKGGGLIYYIRSIRNVNLSFRGTSCQAGAKYLMAAAKRIACH